VKLEYLNNIAGRKGWKIILFALLFVFATSGDLLAVDILYSGCTNGHLENCRCPQDPFGALEKRLPEVERLRQMGDILLLDSGDICPALVDSLGSNAVIEAFELFGYDVVGLGDQDVLQGESILQKMINKLPVVSANIIDKEGKLIAPAYRIIERGGVKFFVTAIIHPSAFYFIEPHRVNYINALDPDSALSAVLSKAPEDSKVIVLSHAGFEIDKENAAKWERVDLIVGGHDQSVINGVETGYGVPIVQAGGNSRYMGVARFRGSRIKAELITIKPELPDDDRMIDLIINFKATKMRMKQKSN